MLTFDLYKHTHTHSRRRSDHFCSGVTWCHVVQTIIVPVTTVSSQWYYNVLKSAQHPPLGRMQALGRAVQFI